MIKILLLLLLITVQFPSNYKTLGVLDFPVPGHLTAWDGNHIIISTNKIAYQRCLKEATIMANFYDKHDTYYYEKSKNGKYLNYGHPLGPLPNHISGTGYSWNGGRPNHCEQGSPHPLIARARVRCKKSGRWFWSTQYRIK